MDQIGLIRQGQSKTLIHKALGHGQGGKTSF